VDPAVSVDADELAILQRANATSEILDVVVHGCAYSCCGRGWQRRDGYWQTYRGRIDKLKLPENGNAGTFMLYSAGTGRLSYVIAARFDEVEQMMVGR
jgi:hypothetical protein